VIHSLLSRGRIASGLALQRDNQPKLGEVEVDEGPVGGLESDETAAVVSNLV